MRASADGITYPLRRDARYLLRSEAPPACELLNGDYRRLGGVQRNASFFREKRVRRSLCLEALAVVSDRNTGTGKPNTPSITTHATEKSFELQSDEGIGRHPTGIQTMEALLPVLAVSAPSLGRIRLSLSKCESVGIDYVNAQSVSLHVHSKCLTKRAPGG